MLRSEPDVLGVQKGPKPPFVIDIDVIDMANEGKMIIVTTDKDFLEDAKRVRTSTGLIHIKSNLREDEIVGVAIRILDYLPSMNGKIAIMLKEHTLIEDLHI